MEGNEISYLTDFLIYYFNISWVSYE